jgi:hypothetical protein
MSPRCEPPDEIVRRLTALLGRPDATPEWIQDADGNRTKSRYRVWRWACPACGAGSDDVGHRCGGYGVITYRPMVVDSTGRCWCKECAATPQEILAAAEHRADLDTIRTELAVWQWRALHAESLLRDLVREQDEREAA